MNNALTQQFEAHRNHLRRVAYRILGSPTEADDAVQEAWIRLARSDAYGGSLENRIRLTLDVDGLFHPAMKNLDPPGVDGRYRKAHGSPDDRAYHRHESAARPHGRQRH